MGPADRTDPKEWVLPNRAGFPEWVYKTFRGVAQTPGQGDGNGEGQAAAGKQLFVQQRLVRDFLQKSSPFTGLLLYHGLGSGKTCTAIAASEGYAYSGRKVVIMLPASLAQNYQNELQSCGNLGSWSAVTLDPAVDPDAAALAALKRAFGYTADFIKRHATQADGKVQLWFPWVPKGRDDGAAITKERCDVWRVRLRKLTEAQRAAVDRALHHIVQSGHVYNFIKYNGLTKKSLEKYTSRFFDDAVVVIDEAHNFISQATHPGTLNYRLYQNLRGARNCRLILLSGTPAINNAFEIGTMLNLLRGPMRVFEVKLPSTADFPSLAMVQERLKARRLNGVTLDRYVDDIRTQPGERAIQFALLPHGYIRSEDASATVEPSAWGKSVAALEAGIAELFAPVERTRVLYHDAYPSNMEAFNDLFIDTSNPEKPRLKERDLFMRRALGLVSYLTNVDDGTYPTVLPERIVECPMTAHQFEVYEKNRKKELEMEQSQARRKAGGREDPFARVSSVYRAFSRMTCNFAFPKELNRPFPRDMKAAQKQMDLGTDDPVMEDTALATEAAAGGRDETQAARKARDAYEAALEDALVRLRTRSEVYLTEDALADVYSPKMARVLRDLHEAPGKVLFYSQFRTVEGIGIMRLALAEAGWAEIDVAKAANGHWRVHGVVKGVDMSADELFAPKYSGKRFVVFNSDREKTEVLMRIFNGQLHMLPASLQRQLAAVGYENPEDNFFGDKCALMMVSQSGAEGISLKHVRRVLILEPFWNKVRIDQVIGRAARRYSHTDLAPEERNVEVRIYTSVFTDEQIAKSFTIQTHEQGISSDTHIAAAAARKDRLIGEFLDALKTAAIDCAVLGKVNQRAIGVRGNECYQFPRGMPRQALAYQPNLEQDRRDAAALQRRVVTKEVQGRVVRTNNKNKKGKKAVLLDGKLYDYDAYKNAGILVGAGAADA